MAITPQDIEQLTFSASKHGYNTEEVDQFLEQLTVEVDAMLQKIADLKGRLTASDQALEAARAQVSQLQDQLAQAKQAQQVIPVSQAPVAAPAYGATEQQISQALIVAQQSADRIVGEARDNADRIRTEADQKAREVIRQALAEKQNELDEIDRLKASREEFRAEYKRLLQHFMDDAESAFPNQIEQAANAARAQHSAINTGTYEIPSETVDVNATVYVPGAGIGLDDLD